MDTRLIAIAQNTYHQWQYCSEEEDDDDCIDAAVFHIINNKIPAPRNVGTNTVAELLLGHEDTFTDILRLSKDTFIEVCGEFREQGLLKDSPQANGAQLEEKVAIFLFIAGMNSDFMVLWLMFLTPYRARSRYSINKIPV